MFLTSVAGMAPKKAQAVKVPKKAAEAAPASEGEQAVAAPKEAKPQAPKEAAKQPAPAAPKEAAKEPAAAAAPEEATTLKEAEPQAPEEAATEAKPQAPKEAAKEAKPQATKEAKEKAEEWLRPGVKIPGWDAESDDSSSGGHSATFSAGEIGELTDVELEAYKTGGPPPPHVSEWDIPSELGIAPVGRSSQNRQWRTMYRKQYRTAAKNVARGMVDEAGNPVKFHVTTDTAPTAYYFVQGKKTTWEA